jgi:hypothetical protein
MKAKKKNSGSVKIDPIIYKKLSDYCKEAGIKVGHFVTKTIEEKLEKQTA